MLIQRDPCLLVVSTASPSIVHVKAEIIIFKDSVADWDQQNQWSIKMTPPPHPLTKSQTAVDTHFSMDLENFKSQYHPLVLKMCKTVSLCHALGVSNGATFISEPFGIIIPWLFGFCINGQMFLLTFRHKMFFGSFSNYAEYHDPRDLHKLVECMQFEYCH